MVKQAHDNWLGGCSFKGKPTFLVQVDQFINHSRITAEHHLDSAGINIGDVALNLETVTVARGQQGGHEQE